MILDHNGHPIDMRRIREEQTAQIGYVAREFDTHPARGLTPARLHAILQAAERGDIVEQLDLADDIEERDGHCFAELDKRIGSVASLEWTIEEPEKASAAEKDLTARVREWLAVIDMEGVLRGLMSAVLRAFSSQEMTWDAQPDGSGRMVLLPRITPRPHRWFTVDRESRNKLLLRKPEMADGQRGEPLIPGAWIAHRHESRNGYLARMGLTRVLCWPYLYKNFATRDLAEFLEIYGLPLRLGKYPSGASDDEKRALLMAVTQIGHNAAGIIPAGMTIDFQNAAAVGGAVPFDSMADRMEAIQSKVIVGQTLTSSEGKNGTQALGNVHEGVRMDIRDSDARQCEGTLNDQLIRPLCLLNVPGADPRRLPKFCLNTVEPEDMASFAENLPPLVEMGIQVPVKWAQDKLQIPEPTEGEAVLQPRAPKVQPGDATLQQGSDEQVPGTKGQKTVPPGGKAQLKAETGAAGPDAIDGLVDEATAAWRPLLQPMVDPLLAELDRAIAAGETLESFGAKLAQMVTAMDYAPMAERLARTSFVASLAGAADLDLDPQEQA